ncbi:MAG: translocation/assembly module TamB domain-containing protein [Candidatus Binatia bacterium]
MAGLLRVSRWIGIAVAAGAVGLVALVALLYVLLKAGLLSGVIDDLVALVAGGDGGFSVRVEGVSGSLPEHVMLAKLEISDDSGVWVVLEDVEVRWHPFELFHPFADAKWRIDVDDARARRATWTRLPEAEDTVEEVEPFQWDEMMPIVVDHLLIEELEIGEAVLGGRTARVRAEGGLVLGTWEQGSVELDITHTDGASGRIAIDLATFGSPLEVEGTIRADEGDGGLLAGLARMPDAGAIDLEIKASGALRDCKLEADLRVENVGRLQADANVAVAPAGAFEVTATFDPAAAERREQVASLAAMSEFDVKTASLDARGSLTGDGRLQATLELAELVIGGVSADEFRAIVVATEPTGEGTSPFELVVEASGLELEGEELPVLGSRLRASAAGSVDLDAGLLVTDELLLDGGAVRVSGPFSLRDDWSSMNATLAAKVSTLESLDEIVAGPVRGSASASIEIAARESWQDFQLAVTAKLTDVSVGEAGWNGLVGGDSTLEANVGGALDGPARGDLQLSAPGITAKASGKVGEDGKGLDVEARFSLDNLQRLGEPARAAIAGKLDGRARAYGSLDEFAVEATVRGEPFSFEGTRFDVLTVETTATGLPEAWTAKVHSTARHGAIEASLDAAVSMAAEDRLEISDVVLRGPRTEGSADLEIALRDALASGNVELESEDLSLWRPMIGMAVSGAISIDATLAASGSGETATQRVSASAHAKRLLVPLDGNEVFVETLDATAFALEIGENPRGRVTVRGKNIRYGDQTLVEGTLEATGDGDAWNLDTRFDLRGQEDAYVEASGRVVPGEAIEGTLARLSGTLDGRSLALQSPATFRYQAADVWSIGQLALRVGESGLLRADGQSTASGLRIDARAEQLPLALASVFATTLALDGTVDGTVQITGPSLEAARGEVSLRGNDIVDLSQETGGLSPVDVQIDARLAGGRVNGTAELQGIGQSRLSVRFEVPTDVASGSAPFEATLVWKGEVGDTLALVPTGENVITGRIDAELRVSGTLDAPRMSGRAVLADGRLEQPAAGLVLTDIRAELAGSGTSLELLQLEAGDGEGGRVQMSGSIAFPRLPAFTATFELRAREAVLSRLDLATTKADADLVVRASRGAGEGADIEGAITGEVRLIDVRVNIPQRFDSDIPEIEVIEVGAQTAATEVTSPASMLALDLDIEVQGDNRIFVTGRGTESEWSADLHIGGTTADPRVEGAITAVRGQIGLLGRRFELTRGTLRFDGEADNVPYLSVIATAEANDITAIAEVTGPATAPSIELRSDPSLPRDEVLSRVLFGQSAATLTPMQSVALARSVAELSGSPLGGGDFLGGVGRTFGLDRLDVGAGAGGDAALTGSKYLADDVYLRVQAGLTPEDSKLSLEWRVFDHVMIESDLSSDAAGEIGVTWRWDY